MTTSIEYFSDTSRKMRLRRLTKSEPYSWEVTKKSNILFEHLNKMTKSNKIELDLRTKIEKLMKSGHFRI